MISAQIIADSVNPAGIRLTTYICKYPRFIHSEVMTHRALSKNASSSRAIPVAKMIQSVIDEPAIPIHWGKNQAGMQSVSELNEKESKLCELNWLTARNDSVESVQALTQIGLHKQVANRLLEPWSHMTTLISGTEWSNFFALRVHPDAQPEFQELAYQMLKLYVNHKPDYLHLDQWHLPFFDKYLAEVQTGSHIEIIKACIGRCARISYKTQEGDYSLENDLTLFDRLANHRPLHATPMEHGAQARDDSLFFTPEHGYSNFKGWTQYRKTIPDENVKEMDFAKHLADYEVQRGNFMDM